MLGKLKQRVCRKAYAGPAGNVVENDRQVAAVSNRSVVGEKAPLRRLVVIRGNRKAAFGATLLGKPGQFDCIIRVVRTDAGNNGNPVVDILAAPGENLAMLLVVQGG